MHKSVSAEAKHLECSSPQSGAQRWQCCDEQGGTGPLLGVRGLGCSGALAPGHTLPQLGAQLLQEGKGSPHPVWGVLTLQSLLHKCQLELLSGA